MKSIQLVLGLLLAASAVTAQQYTISTYAGIPLDRGWFSDGSAANTIPLGDPLSLALDGKGNLYINDFQNWLIRKVNSSGIMTSVAGTGTPSYAGDGAAATAAQLFGVHGIAADALGNVYLCETALSRIRKIDTSGNITTIVGNGTRGYAGDGGNAPNAEITFPVGVAVDASNNFYFTDYGTYTVRKVTAPGNGSVVSTIAGTANVFGYPSTGDGGPATKATFGFPEAIAVDAAGNIYISDTANLNIRKITTDGNIHTVATGVNAIAMAVDAAGNIYYPDYVGNVVRRINPDGTQVVIAGIGTAGYGGDNGPANFAQFNTPSGIALDAAGNIYVADSGNEIVRVLKPVTTGISGIANAASNASAAAAGTYVAPGEIISIYGVGLGPAKLVSNQPNANGAIGTTLSGTSVNIGGYAAPVLYTSATQVGAIVPYELGIGTAVNATVTYNGQTTPAAGLTVAAAAPGVFTANGSGTGQGAIVNQGTTLNSVSSPAPLGSIVSIYVTGEGRTYPNGIDGLINYANYLPYPALPVSVSIGGVNAVVSYAGGQFNGVEGLMQVNAQVPTSLAQSYNFASGAVAVPVVVNVGGFVSQSGVTMAVSLK